MPGTVLHARVTGPRMKQPKYPSSQGVYKYIKISI